MSEEQKALFFVAMAFSIARKVGGRNEKEQENFADASEFLKVAEENKILIKDVFA